MVKKEIYILSKRLSNDTNKQNVKFYSCSVDKWENLVYNKGRKKKAGLI